MTYKLKQFFFRNKKKQIHIDLTEGSIKKHLFNLSYPMAIGFFAIMTFNLVDTFFISFLGTDALAAIGFTFPIIMIIISLFLGLSIGNNILVSRAFGQNNSEKAARFATDGLLLGLLIVFIFTTLGLLFKDNLFLFLGVPKYLLKLVDEYMFPWFLGLVFMAIPFFGDKTLAAMGNTKIMAKIMIIASILNVFLDPLLIFGFGFFPKMGIAGASWATVFSRAVSTILIIYVLNKKGLLIKPHAKFLHEMIKSWKAMIKISIPTSFNTVMIQFVLLVFNKIMASFGVAFIAGFGVAIKIEAFFTVLLIAVGASMPSFIGQNFGAKRHDRIKTALNYNVGFAFIWSLFCFITFFFFGKLFISFFVKDEIIINHAYLYLLITSISYLGVELMYASHSLFNSIDKSYYSSFYTFIQTTVIIATVYFCSLKMGAIGGLIGLTIGRIAMGLIEFINAKLLLKEDVDTGRFVYLKPHFIFKKIKDVLSLNSYIKDKIKDWEM